MSEYGTMAVDGCNVATATERIATDHPLSSWIYMNLGAR